MKLPITAHLSEVRSCVKVEVAVLGSAVPNSPYGLCGRKATLNVLQSELRTVCKSRWPSWAPCP